MVQILQQGPTEATLRQQALNDSLNTAIQGFAGYEQKKKQEALTKRQQALEDQKIKSDSIKTLVSGGYEINPTNLDLIQGKDVAAPVATPAQPAQAAQPMVPGVADAYKEPVVSPADLKRADEPRVAQVMATQKEAVPAQVARPEVLGPKPQLTYTAQKQAKIEAEKVKAGLEQKVLQGKVDALPLDTQKKQVEIQKIEEENKMRPIEKAAKLADIEWKHSQAASKVDEKTDKRFSDFAKTVSNPTTRNALGSFGKNLASADRIKVLTDSYTNGAKPGSPEEIAALNKLSSQQAEEVTKSLDSLLSGGASTISGADHLRFQTLASQWADLKQKYKNQPEGAELGAFLSRAMETVSRERDYNSKQVDRILSGLGEGFSDLRKKDEGRFRTILNSAYDKGDSASVTKSVAPPAPGTDPAFEAWKKAKGHS
jgi:hypothetical protein